MSSQMNFNTNYYIRCSNRSVRYYSNSFYIFCPLECDSEEMFSWINICRLSPDIFLQIWWQRRQVERCDRGWKLITCLEFSIFTWLHTIYYLSVDKKTRLHKIHEQCSLLSSVPVVYFWHALWRSEYQITFSFPPLQTILTTPHHLFRFRAALPAQVCSNLISPSFLSHTLYSFSLASVELTINDDFKF